MALGGVAGVLGMVRDVDTFNRFLVGSHGEEVVMLVRVPQRLAREDALNLAAWLVAITDPAGDDFRAVLDAVLAT